MKSKPSSEWTTLRLDELADLSWGDTKTTKASYVTDGYPAFSASGPDGFLPYYEYERDGVVLSAIGANCGRVYFAKGKWSCIKNTIRFWGRQNIADTHFLYYATSDPRLWPKRGSAQPFISQGDARAVTISLPVDRDEQLRIVWVLSSLDEKIYSNRCLASLLEEATSTAFRARFVDFVEIKELKESAIGRIPYNWHTGNLGDLIRLKYGQALRAQDRRPGNVSVVGSSGIIGNHDQALVDGPAVIIGRKGVAGSVIWIGRDNWPIDTTFIAEPIDDTGSVFIYFLLCQANLQQLTADSAVPGLNRVAAEERMTVIPPAETIREFTFFANPMFNHKDKLETEAETLAEIRDTLLPKLISGEIRVPDTNDSNEVIGPVAEQLTQATK